MVVYTSGSETCFLIRLRLPNVLREADHANENKINDLARNQICYESLETLFWRLKRASKARALLNTFRLFLTDRFWPQKQSSKDPKLAESASITLLLMKIPWSDPRLTMLVRGRFASFCN